MASATSTARRVAASAILAVALVVATIMIAAPEASAAGCRSSSSASVSGGYRVTLYCDGQGWVDGYGSTPTAASRHALVLHELFLASGMACTGTGSRAVTGGYESTIYCGGRGGSGFTDGQGSSLSDAAAESYELAALVASSKGLVDCSATHSPRRVRGGYEATLHCDGGIGFVEGRGSTLTEAAQRARLSVS